MILKRIVIFFSILNSFILFSCSDADSKIADTKTISSDSLSCGECAYNYPWMNESQWKIDSTICRRFVEPGGFARVQDSIHSFGAWLRGLPLLPEGTQVHLYNGDLKWNQSAQAAVINIDVGNKDLQQCADAVMRLRAEYLFATKQYNKISFNYTSGDKQDYARWVNGRRIQVAGNATKEVWGGKKYSVEDHAALMLYLNDVFSFCGTLSLSKELKKISSDDIAPGDVFIHGGTPGHAEIVIDVAVNANGKKAFMLAQSYMPAQQIHILRDPAKDNNDPWYALDFGQTLATPEYSFDRGELMRWQ